MLAPAFAEDTHSFAGLAERYFRLREHASTLRIEVLGGVTTFATMAYIIVVNPAVFGVLCVWASALMHVKGLCLLD